MGNFYVNISMKDVSAEDLFQALSGRDAIIGPAKNGWTTFVDAEFEWQDYTVIETLAADLSRRLATSAIAVLNHDDDYLSVDTWTNGHLVSDYNSFPGAFDEDPSPDRMTPKLSGAEALASLSGGATTEEVRALFEGRGRDFVFAVELHGEIAALMGLPDYSVGFGHGYAAEGSLAVTPKPMLRTRA